MTHSLEPPRRSDSQAREIKIREWILRFALNSGKELSKESADALVLLWCDEFSDIPLDMLEKAFRKLIRTSRFFPTIADVRGVLDGADAKARELEAQEEWRKALDVATNFYQPDIGLYRNAPRLSPATWHALKVAGGLDYLFNATHEQLQWARRRFLEDFALIHETRQVEHLLGDGTAKRVLATLRAGPGPNPARKTLPPAKELAAEKPVREEVERVFKAMGVEKPSEERRRSGAFQTALRNIGEIKKGVKELEKELQQDQLAPPSEEDLRRARDQQQRLCVWQAQHGASNTKNSVPELTETR